MKAKIVWRGVGFNNGEINLRGSFQQSVLVNKVSACLAIVLILHPSIHFLSLPGKFIYHPQASLDPLGSHNHFSTASPCLKTPQGATWNIRDPETQNKVLP